MAELSDRFAELMARMAKTDAELFRTIGQQNANVRQMVDELTVAAAPDDQPPDGTAALAPAGLLPADDCDLKALKARFGKIATAQAWIEAKLGNGPKKPTWAVIEQTCRTGAWPASLSPRRSAASGLTAQSLEEHLGALEQRLDQRLLQMERLLALIAEAVMETR